MPHQKKIMAKWERGLMIFRLNPNHHLQLNGWVYRIKGWTYGPLGIANTRKFIHSAPRGAIRWMIVHHRSKESLCWINEDFDYVKRVAEKLIQSNVDWNFDTWEQLEINNNINLTELIKHAQSVVQKQLA